jgi:hypothetical protein
MLRDVVRYILASFAEEITVSITRAMVMMEAVYFSEKSAIVY